MQRYIVLCAIALLIGALTQIPASAQEKRPPVKKQDTGQVVLTFDGKEKTATAVAYVIGGRLYLTGMWLNDSSARYGTDAIASAYVLRVENKVGDHPINPESIGETLFSMIYSGPVAEKAYAIFRSDERGGNGMVTIHSITDASIRGSFSFKAYNLENPAEFRTVSGRFDVPYRAFSR